MGYIRDGPVAFLTIFVRNGVDDLTHNRYGLEVACVKVGIASRVAEEVFLRKDRWFF